MNTYPFRISVKAPSQSEAKAKLRCAGKLMAALDARTLAALAERGPGLLSGPQGGMIRSYLGLG